LAWLGGPLSAADEIEVLSGDRIFELLAQKMSLNEYIDIRREHARTGTTLKQPDRACILLPAKDQFFLLFAARGLFPDRHGNGHENGHHAERHEERRHGVTRLRTRVLGLTL
jgi:hypothetical protein